MAESLSVGGLASGIDTKSLISALINAERAPARLAESARSKAQSRLDAVKAMNGKLLALRDAMDALKQSSAFGGKTATSSNETALTATATSTAVAGNLVVNVKTLAAAHQVASAGQTLASTDLGAGTVVVKTSSSSEVTVTPTTNTLSGLAEAINAANAGVVASIVNDGSANPYRLVVTSAKTGTANAITKLEGTGGFAGIVPNLAGMTQVTAAEDATVRLGNATTGLLLTSSTNSMSEAIPGVTLTLKAQVDGINLTVSQDTKGVGAAVQKLVDTYNDAVSYYNSNSTFDATTKRSGALFGDYDLRSQLDAVERALTQSFPAQATGFQSLSEVGVKVGTDGKMTFDATTFNTKLAAGQSSLAALFLAGAGAGSTVMDGLTRSVNGAMALKQANLESDIKSLGERITAIDARLERRKAFYQSKFLQMEKLTAQFQSQGNSLAGFANSLNRSSK